MAQNRAAAAMVVSALLSGSAVAHGQSFVSGSAGVSDVDPPIEADLTPNVQSAGLPPCPCTPTMCAPSCMPLIAPEVSEDELEAVLIGGASAAALGYLVSNVIVSTQPHRTPVVDAIPIFGAVWSVAHNETADRTTPMLLFSAGIQAIGLLVTVASATELHDLRKLGIDLGVSANGAGASLTWHY